MVVLKASSYGNGETEVVQLLEKNGADAIAVALTDEGVFYRKIGVELPILVFLTAQSDFEKIVEHRLEPSLFSIDLLLAFIAFLDKKGMSQYPVHIKLDTGMNRLGIKEEELEEAQNLLLHPAIKISSVFSHLMASEVEEKDTYSEQQFEKFDAFRDYFKKDLNLHPDFHMLNTRGITRFPSRHYDMVRLGIGLYGYSGLPQDDLKLVSQLLTTVLQIKDVKKGECIGYGANNPVDEDKTIALIAIGYADGISRSLGNGRGSAVINGHKFPFIGDICMDISMLEITPNSCQIGDTVELFGHHIGIEEMARDSYTIPYEVYTSLSKRVKRFFVEA